jgi:hypothetical protein
MRQSTGEGAFSGMADTGDQSIVWGELLDPGQLNLPFSP